MRRFLPLVILLFSCTQLWAQTLNVPSVDYPTIQSAIDEALNYDTIVVAPGTYNENINFLGKPVTVKSADPNNTATVETTIIDGNQPADANYASVVTFNSSEGADSILEGFTICGGTGTWIQVNWWRPASHIYEALWNRCGGGILCIGASPTIRKNIIRDNLTGEGGGIYMYDHSSPLIEDNTIKDNQAILGHGFEDPDKTDPNTYDHGDGGAIVAFEYCNPTVRQNAISNNIASFYGGAIHFRQWSDGRIHKNHIYENYSLLGGGIHITYLSDPNISENLIEHNAVSSLGGGGIYVYYRSNPLIQRNTVRHNVSTEGAGIAVYYTSAPTIINNYIYRNEYGSAIECSSSSPSIRHNTITANSAGPTSAGIECKYSSHPHIENNIIASNPGCGGIYANTDSSPTIRYNNLWSNPAGNYSPDIAHNADANGNISDAPSFVDADTNNFHLNYDSPCIDAGDPDFAGPYNFDFDWDARIIGSYVDIGADEACPVWNITFGGQYQTIQSAIDDANDFDTIVVLPGEYQEMIDFGGTNLILRSLEPNDWAVVENTIIDANNLGITVTFQSGEDANAMLCGFTITGGYHPTSDGGGIICVGGSSPVISRNIITGNAAKYGGGLYLQGSAPTIERNYIVGNQAINTPVSYGGGLLTIDCHETFIIANNIIAENQAKYGGGCLLMNSRPVFTNNTIVNNIATGNMGGGVYWTTDKTELTNSIVWGNGSSNLYNTPARYSCIEGGQTGEGNISIDPNLTAGYHLRPCSPCINEGSNTLAAPELNLDFDREQRIFDTTIDIGADEFVSNPFDLNEDGIVDYLEMRELSLQWRLIGPGRSCDFNNDQTVNFKDYAFLASQWLWKGGWLE